MSDGPGSRDVPAPSAMRATRQVDRVARDDPTIPVLTERITLPAFELELDLPQPPLTQQDASSAVTTGSSAAPTKPEHAAGAAAPKPPPDFLIDAQLQPLREAIVLALARELPAQAEQLVHRHLESALEETAQRLAAALRAALSATLRQAVELAVQEELRRIASPMVDTPPAADR
ncbi:MAG: hypothetical protein RMK97_08705 [Sutterellaceae bacterium]|nr:hypothetical protein [Burkholderiaceae bacterium]MCX7901040.1 hypothetical protein [Burkholderiaceae bacterium]MDW8430561.1 hypothetical protein [Sutterellaceae bacterium]